MKKVNLTLITIALLLLNNFNYAQIFLYEDFESGMMPNGWTEDIISEPPIAQREWRFENGGYADPDSPDFRNPPNAYEGVFNALFQDESDGPETILITPAIDMRTAIKPELSFWHAQESWGGDIDELRVYFRADSVSAWVLLEEYTSATVDWVQRIILIPDEAKTQFCQIGFKGTSKWGWGVCIDEVIIEEKGILPRQVESFSVSQVSGFFPSGSNINNSGHFYTFVTGNTGDVPINSIVLNYTGTSISDITGVSLYYTRENTFNIPNPIESEYSIEENQITITAPDFSLQTSDNYVWITFDISIDAQHGNTVDYTYSANSVDLGVATFPASQQNPSQKSYVERTMLYLDMESMDGLTLNNDWEMGIPEGGGAGDPDYPFEGLWVLATNLNGNYDRAIPPDNPHQAFTQSLDAKYYRDLNVRYKRWLNIDFFDKTSVKVSNNNGDTWIKVWENTSSVFDRSWRSIGHSLSPHATRQENVRVMFSIDTTNNTLEYGGWNIDNLAITGYYIAQDVGVLNMLRPEQACGLTDNEQVRVTISNFGAETVDTPFEVGYSLDDGVTWSKNTFGGTIDPDQEITFIFSQNANFSSPGLKNIKFKTFLEGDDDPSNDIYSKSIYVFPTVSYPYQAIFEQTSMHWYPSGSNSSWQWGTPAGTAISMASAGTKVWATSLASNYKNDEFSYLESPCFDLNDAEYPVFAFDYMLQVEEGIDGFTVEYSTDGGLTWDLLPQHDEYAFNWFDTPTVTALQKAGWSTNQTDSYVTVKNLLPNDINYDGVKFRFVFASDGENTYEGVAIDNVRVYELPYDVGVTQLISPVSTSGVEPVTACEIGHVKLKFEIENFGYRPLPEGEIIPIKVVINDNPAVNESAELSAVLASGGVIEFETENTYNLFAAKTYDISISTNFAVDDDPTNDELSVQLVVNGLPGYSLGPDIGTLQTEPFDPVIQIDAGEGYDDTSGWTFEWTPGSSTNQILDVTTAGTYSVDVVNENGCPKSDEITVWLSDMDVGVIDYDNTILLNACENSDLIFPEVTLKNFGPGTNFDTETVPVVVMVNGIEELQEDYVHGGTWAVDDEISFTFSNSIDLSEPNTYDIRMYTLLTKDLDKDNDTTKIEISTWGTPDAILYTRVNSATPTWEEFDSISTINADTLVFKVDDIFQSYEWYRKYDGESWTLLTDETNHELALNTLTDNLRSAWYKVIVTAFNGCGTDEDAVYVNAKDLGVFSIDSPLESVCFDPDGIEFTMTIRNFGQDIYPEGSFIDATCITPVGTQEVSIELEDDLTPGNNIEVTFPELVQLVVGDNFVRLSTSVEGDSNPDNDFKEMLLNVKPSPTVTIEPDTLFKVFGADENYEIVPIYTDDCLEENWDCLTYQWHDFFTTDSTYWIAGPPLYEVYEVTVTNNQDCTASASMVAVSDDLAITAFKSPVSDCELEDDTPIIFTLRNTGNHDFTAGEKIEVLLTVNGDYIGTEEIEFSEAFEAGSSMDVTLSETLNLAEESSVNVHLEVTSDRNEVNYENNKRDRTVYAQGYPTPDLGEDREVHAYEETLDPGLFDSYLWNDDSTERTFTATETGTYSVTVVDFSGCEGSGEVTLTFFVDDLSIISLDEPQTGCELSDAETVQITIKNTGTWTIPADSTISIGFNRDAEEKSEIYTFTEPFEPEETLQISLVNTMDLSVRKTHTVYAWVSLESDMVQDNDTLEAQITAHPDVRVNFGVDTIFITGPYVLDPGEYFGYLWSTGEETQTITVEQSGTYWVEVYNEQGCSHRDTVVVRYTLPDLRIERLISPISDCILPDNQTVTAEIINLGEYVFPIEDTVFVSLWFNANLIAEEYLILPDDLGSNETINHTFNPTVNLSQIGQYSLTVSVYHPEDTYSANDTTEFIVNHWGNPNVDLGDDFVACSHEERILDAGNEGSTYLWSTGETTQTILPTETDTYSVTVTNENGCQASDDIDVTILPSTETTLDEFDPVCSNTEELELTGGLPEGGIYDGPGVIDGIFYPAEAGAGNHPITYSFTNEYECTTTDTSYITVYQAPIVDLGGDQTITSPIVLDAGDGFVSYLWQDGSTEQTYTVTQTGIYHVTVTDENGCQGYDEVYIFFDVNHYLIITELISPAGECRIPNLPVEVQITNESEETIASGEILQVFYRVQGANPVSETLTLSQAFNPEESINYLFDQGLTISAGTHELDFWIVYNDVTGTITTHEAEIYPVPEVDLGPDSLEVTFPYTLIAGVGDVDYLWSNGSTQESITVYETGTYWLRVTNSYGCSASDTIYLYSGTWINEIPGINSVVKVYPNPVNDRLTVEVTSPKPYDYKFELVSPLGQKVFQSEVRNQQTFSTEIDVSPYTPGVYLLRISAEGKYVVARIVINR